LSIMAYLLRYGSAASSMYLSVLSHVACSPRLASKPFSPT